MARTLSDTIIISMVEAATRLASGRGPISGGPGGAGAHGAAGAAHTEAGGPVGQESGATTDATAGGTGSTGAPSSTGSGSGGSGPRGDEHDPRTAEQIAHDFRTIYLAIEEVVKSSAEQETKAVGFAPR